MTGTEKPWWSMRGPERAKAKKQFELEHPLTSDLPPVYDLGKGPREWEYHHVNGGFYCRNEFYPCVTKKEKQFAVRCSEGLGCYPFHSYRIVAEKYYATVFTPSGIEARFPFRGPAWHWRETYNQLQQKEQNVRP
jgi:hypothetical protein